MEIDYKQKILLRNILLPNSKMTTPNLTGNWSLDFPNESVKVIQWHGFFSILLICFCSAFAIITTAGKSMIIYFILYKAPKRPMNTMILLDQVSGSNNICNETFLEKAFFRLVLC